MGAECAALSFSMFSLHEASAPSLPAAPVSAAEATGEGHHEGLKHARELILLVGALMYVHLGGEIVLPRVGLHRSDSMFVNVNFDADPKRMQPYSTSPQTQAWRLTRHRIRWRSAAGVWPRSDSDEIMRLLLASIC